MADQPQCPICQAELGDDPADSVTLLLCSHSFHSECLQGYCTVAKMPLERIKCPICKMTSDDILNLESRQPPAAAAASSFRPGDAQEIDSDDDESEVSLDEAPLAAPPAKAPAKRSDQNRSRRESRPETARRSYADRGSSLRNTSST